MAPFKPGNTKKYRLHYNTVRYNCTFIITKAADLWSWVVFRKNKEEANSVTRFSGIIQPCIYGFICHPPWLCKLWKFVICLFFVNSALLWTLLNQAERCPWHRGVNPRDFQDIVGGGMWWLICSDPDCTEAVLVYKSSISHSGKLWEQAGLLCNCYTL